MTTLKKTVFVTLVAACSWGRFDDLKGNTGVTLGERPGNLSGNLGVSVIGITPTADGAVVIAGLNGTAGLTRFDIDVSGEITETIAAEATATGAGDLSPLKALSPPSALAAFGSTDIVVGAPNPMFNGAAVYGIGIIGTGRTLFTSSKMNVGSSVAVGNLGVGNVTIPDVVVTAANRVYVIPDGSNTTPATVCQFRQPQPPSIAGASIFVKSVTVHDISGSPQIVVSGSDGTNQAWVRIMAAPTFPAANDTGTDVEECVGGGFTTGSTINDAPFALAVGNVDSDTTPDIVAGTLGSAGSDAKVCIYLNVTTSSTPTCTEIPKPEMMGATYASSREQRGARVALGDFEGDSKDEIVVSDPAALHGGTETGGAVAIYKFDGTVKLLSTLFPLDVDSTSNFGRDLAVVLFKHGGTTTNVLGVGMNDKVVLYFKPTPASVDPRQR